MFLAFDVGGSKVAFSLYSKEGEEVKKGIIRHKGSVKGIIREILKKEGKKVEGVGYSVAGQVMGKEVIKSPNIKDIEGENLEEITRKIVKGVREVVVENDANCFAIAQYYSKYKDKESLFAVIWGTGVGGGIVHKGEIVKGESGMAGEIGHVTYKINGKKCGCGKRGCYEAYLGGKHLDKIAKRMGREHLDYSSDMFYHLTFHAFTHLIKTIVLMLNPEVIVLGGGIGKRLNKKYIEEVIKKVKEEVSYKCNITIEQAKEEEQGVKGCYYLLNKPLKI